MRLAQFLKIAHAKLTDFLSTKAVTTHDGMLKAMALKAERATRQRSIKSRGVLVASKKHKRNDRLVPIFYAAPPAVRLNRSRHLPYATSYTHAKQIDGAIA